MTIPPATDDFKSVKRHTLLLAFAIAHAAAQDGTMPQAAKKRFRKIRELIWKSCGETRELSSFTRTDDEVLELLASSELRSEDEKAPG